MFKHFRAVWLNFPGLGSLLLLTSLCGMVIYAQYKDCDPITNGDIYARDQVKALLVKMKKRHCNLHCE